MKTVVTALALATLIATPVLAQSAKHTTRQAQPLVQQTQRGNPYSVYVNGKYIGTDPDAHIRTQLMNDPEQGGDGSSGD